MTASSTPAVPRIRVLAADDHAMIRDGIAAVIGAQPDMEWIGEASDGREAVAQFRRLQPDVTLLDLNMPHMNGVEVIHAIRAEAPQARIVVLTTYAGDVQATRAIKAGAIGYLLKSSLRKELLNAIRDAHHGRRHIPDEIAHAIARHLGMEELGQREITVVRHVAAGLSNKEIAARLSITEETVKTHIKNILAKLNANDRSHAIAIALERGFIDI